MNLSRAWVNFGALVAPLRRALPSIQAAMIRATQMGRDAALDSDDRIEIVLEGPGA